MVKGNKVIACLMIAGVSLLSIGIVNAAGKPEKQTIIDMIRSMPDKLFMCESAEEAKINLKYDEMELKDGSWFISADADCKPSDQVEMDEGMERVHAFMTFEIKDFEDSWGLRRTSDGAYMFQYGNSDNSEQKPPKSTDSYERQSEDDFLNSRVKVAANDFIRNQVKDWSAHEFEENRLFLKAKLGKTDDYYIVFYAMEGMGGGESYGAFIAIFRDNGSKATYLDYKQISGKGMGAAKFSEVEEGKITFSTTEYAKDDPMCCPSLKRFSSYKMVNGSLKRID